MANELRIAGEEAARNDERYLDWIAKGGPKRAAQERRAAARLIWAALTTDTQREAEDLARLEREQDAARAWA